MRSQLRPVLVVAMVLTLTITAPAPVEGSPKGTGGVVQGKVVKAVEGKLTITVKDGKDKQELVVPATAKITTDGKECKLQDLKAGDQVKVTFEKKKDEKVVTKIEATKKSRD